LQLGIDYRTKAFIVERCLQFVRGPRVLDLGYVDGQWSDALRAAGHAVDIVEGAGGHAEHARRRYADDRGVRIYHALFQDFQPQDKYGTVIAGDMLRYLADPSAFLASVTGWLEHDGRLIVSLPNSRSLHRRVGSLMNLEPAPTEANGRDRQVGNLRSYDRYELRQLLLSSGWEVEVLHGCFLKPLSSAQMADWSDVMLRAFLDVGNELEDYCWFLYAVCRVRGPQ
jgi:2-polyprenyl-3-methyl-5-hydroxy-6-metoxy-1,4-benzoquinol methylase